MSKTTRILLAIGLILAVATPALAEFKLNGYYRLMGYSGEVRSGGNLTGDGRADAFTKGEDEDGDTRSLIDQRLRLKATYSLNDNVAVVWFGEIDTVWGNGTSTGTGGQLGADSVNVETKNAYLDLKSGDTTAQIGVIGLADNYEGMVFNHDMAGINLNHKMGATGLNVIYSKFYEGDSRDYDDTDLYGVAVSQKVSDDVKVGASIYFLDVNAVDQLAGTANVENYRSQLWDPSFAALGVDDWSAEVFYYGLNADAKFGSFGLSGFAVYQDLEVKYDNGTVSDSADGKAYMASVKGAMKLDNGDVGLRAIYVSADKDENDVDQWYGNFGQYEFANENLMQFLVDKFVCNYGKERYAFNDAVYNGFGLMALVASGNHKLPSDMYLNWGAGYFRAVTDDVNDDNVDDAEGKTLGWEAAARIGKKYFEKVDVSLNLSYADYGNFYDNTAPKNGVADAGDPDATYKAYLMVNVPF
ncbi:MAG: hypothetical protein FIB02_10755 [Desulfuromonas sp.]|nr:hypothetical protein [Desulfuromonas sp.]